MSKRTSAASPNGSNFADPQLNQYLCIRRTLQRSQIEQIAMGPNHFLVLLDSGLVYAWGDNQLGQLGVGKSVHRCETPMLVSSLLDKRVVMVAFRPVCRSDRHVIDAFARIGRDRQRLRVGRQSQRRLRRELAFFRLSPHSLLPKLHTHRCGIPLLRLRPPPKRSLRLWPQSRRPMRRLRRRNAPRSATDRRLPVLSRSPAALLRR